MVLPFQRQPLLHKRYAYLSLPAGTDTPNAVADGPVNGEEYANFLK